MRRIKQFSTFLLLFIITPAFAQPWANILNSIPKDDPTVPEYRRMMTDVNVSWYDVEVAYRNYWASQNRTPSEEEGGSEYERYMEFMQANSDENGFYQPERKTADFWDEIRATRKSNARSRQTANWTPIGPELIGNGDSNNSRMHSVYQDPTNNNILFAGAGSAGVWKSTDGGTSWMSISHTIERVRDIQSVIPDRNDVNHIMAASRDQGLYRTTDGGANWTRAAALDDANRLLQHPTTATTWYVACDGGFYESTNNGVSWTLLLAGAIMWDVELHPTNPDIIYVLEEFTDANGQNQRIFKSIDGGANFSQLTNGLPDGATTQLVRAEIAVTPAAPDNLYAAFAGDDGADKGLWGIYISTDAGDSFTFQCCGDNSGGPYSAGTNPNILGYSTSGSSAGGQLNFQQSLYVSPNDANIIFSGGVRLWKSFDMGLSWTVIANTYHSDNHGLYINDNGHIYTATDGGVHVSTDGGVVFESLTNGIYGTEFIGDFGFSRKNAEVMIGGTIHNGALGKYEDVAPAWTFYAGGDLREGYIDMAQNMFRVSPNSSNNQIRRSKDKGNSFQLLSTASRYIAAHPHTPSILYSPDAGLFNLWKSTDDGSTWSKITDFSTTTSVAINDIQICETAPQNIALNLRDERMVAVSNDGGQTWTNKTIPIHGSRKVDDLIINHTNPQVMWIVYDREYVYKTTDGGDNWIDYNTGIDPSLNLQCITHHVGSDGAVYLGGRDMVYYRDNTMSSWTPYSVGLPTYIDIKDIEIIYDTDKIRLSSNRSVWESDLNSTAQPVAAIAASVTQISSCDNLQVHFYDASFTPTAGTTWNWTFEGGDPATSTEQNPLVVYTAMGDYDVTLQVTNGGTDTRAITDLITVNNIPTTSLPINEDIENLTLTGTPPCNPNNTLGGSLTNLTNSEFSEDSGDWQVNSGSGIISRTAPSMDFTEMTQDGQYLYLRGSHGCATNETAAILMDCMDLSSLNEPTLKFAYHANHTSQSPNPELHIDVQSNGVWTEDVLVINGEQGID